MRKIIIVLLAAAIALAAGTPVVVAADSGTTVTQDTPTCEYPLELEDATGETVTIEDEPDSVVALQPSDAQTLFEIGAEEKIVGMPVGQYTDYLDADAELDISASDDVTPVSESVIDREPDVVLAANALEGDDVIEQLRNAGLTVYVFPTEESIEGVKENVRLTGQIVGECDGAAETLEWMDDRLDAVEETVGDTDRPLEYYAMGGGFTAGSGTFQDEILTTAGVENLGADAGIEGWQEITTEVVVDADPEWIVYGESFGEPPVDEAVMGTTAAENEQFIAVNDNYLSQPGPLVVLAIESIAQTIDEADDEADASESGSDSIPGFGVPAVFAALLAVFGAGFRRS